MHGLASTDLRKHLWARRRGPAGRNLLYDAPGLEPHLRAEFSDRRTEDPSRGVCALPIVRRRRFIVTMMDLNTGMAEFEPVKNLIG
jgi:hypothetical protein